MPNDQYLFRKKEKERNRRIVVAPLPSLFYQFYSLLSHQPQNLTLYLVANLSGNIVLASHVPLFFVFYIRSLLVLLLSLSRRLIVSLFLFYFLLVVDACVVLLGCRLVSRQQSQATAT